MTVLDGILRWMDAATLVVRVLWYGAWFVIVGTVVAVICLDRKEE